MHNDIAPRSGRNGAAEALPIDDQIDHFDADPDFRRRWPPDQYPALYLGAADYLALRRRKRQRRRLLNLLAEDIADIALAVAQEVNRARA